VRVKVERLFGDRSSKNEGLKALKGPRERSSMSMVGLEV
jgi:hypothetical protein